MTKSPNRRAMLTGAIAIAAAALPMVAQAASINADAELFDLIRQWEAGKALEISFGAEHSATEHRAQANEPPVPPELLQPIDLALMGLVTPGHARGWTVAQLERLNTARGKELLAIKERYDAAYDEVWKEATAGQERYDDIVSANTDIVNQLGETPAHTLQGLMAKCRVAQEEGLFVNFMDFSDFAQSIVEDLERLAPQLTVRA